MGVTTQVTGALLGPHLVHGRAINAVSALLRRQLRVPHIFLQPTMPEGPKLDLLAVDAAGSGDLHGVQVSAMPGDLSRELLHGMVEAIKSAPVHFKYVAVPAHAATLAMVREVSSSDALFASDGLGRVGVLAFDERLLSAETSVDAAAVSTVVSPERFLVRGDGLARLEHYLETTQPDMQVRV